MGGTKLDYTSMAKEMAIAAEIVSKHNKGHYTRVMGEIEFKKRAGRYLRYATIEKISKGE